MKPPQTIGRALTRRRMPKAAAHPAARPHPTRRQNAEPEPDLTARSTRHFRQRTRILSHIDGSHGRR